MEKKGIKTTIMLHTFQLQVNGLSWSYIYVGMYKHILVIQIDDAVSIHSEAIRMFFCILYAAVHYLIENPITSRELCISPTRSISLSKGPEPQVEPCHVFWKGDHMYKLYDTEVDSTNFLKY